MGYSCLKREGVRNRNAGAGEAAGMVGKNKRIGRMGMW